jgi:ribose transport system permease protein
MTSDNQMAEPGTAVHPPDEQRPKPRVGNRVVDFLSICAAEYGILLFLIVMCVGFSLWLPATFPTTRNLQSLLGNQAIPGILALAVIIPLAAGEFDLSIAANLGFCSLLAAKLVAGGMPTELVIPIVVIVGGLIGLVNSLIVVGIGVNAFIATLGMSTILTGGNLVISGGETIFEGIGSGFTSIATTKVIGVEIIALYFLIAAFAAWYAMERTPFGRYLRATGLARESARLSGISTTTWLALGFIAAGAMAGLCGVLETAHVGSATSTAGAEFLLPAYAAAFLGATAIRRGMFNVWGTVVGVFVLAVGINGLTLASAPIWMPDVFNGTALIVAVSGAAISARRRERDKRARA